MVLELARASPSGESAALRSRLQRLFEDDARTRLVALAGLVLLNLVIAVGGALAYDFVPLTTFVIPMLLASLLLPFRPFLAMVALQTVCVVTVLAVVGPSFARVVVLVVLASSAAVLAATTYRAKSVLRGAVGESMLIDLRDRLQLQGELPAMPGSWYAQAALRSANGAQFAGDFMVASRAPGSSVLEVVVVDVSGKGLGAGTRALQLSGAFGGLLGALPPTRFLPAANRYLLRQEWDEGFATAVHVTLDLDSGAFEVRTAGHPPALHWRSAPVGSWEPRDSEGPALGLLAKATFRMSSGVLAPGDALVLYTDGLVETPAQDFTVGIDRLMERAGAMAETRFEGAATSLLDEVDAPHDDRAVVVIARR